MKEESSVSSWIKQLTQLLSKTKVDINEEKMIIFGMRLVMTLLEIHTGWIGEELMSTTFMEMWVGAHTSFGKLWIKSAKEKDMNNDVIIIYTGEKEKKDGNSNEKMTTPKSALTFAGDFSNLKLSLSRSKPQGSSHIYFRPRSNKKATKKRGMLKHIVFTIYLKLSKSISNLKLSKPISM